MIEPGKLNGYLVAIKDELRKAEGKHPDFCEAQKGCNTGKPEQGAPCASR